MALQIYVCPILFNENGIFFKKTDKLTFLINELLTSPFKSHIAFVREFLQKNCLINDINKYEIRQSKYVLFYDFSNQVQIQQILVPVYIDKTVNIQTFVQSHGFNHQDFDWWFNENVEKLTKL